MAGTLDLKAASTRCGRGAGSTQGLFALRSARRDLATIKRLVTKPRPHVRPAHGASGTLRHDTRPLISHEPHSNRDPDISEITPLRGMPLSNANLSAPTWGVRIERMTRAAGRRQTECTDLSNADLSAA